MTGETSLLNLDTQVNMFAGVMPLFQGERVLAIISALAGRPPKRVAQVIYLRLTACGADLTYAGRHCVPVAATSRRQTDKP